jgi:hypothetical protein
MMTIETAQIAPLTLTDEGTIRITGSRVSIDSIIHHYVICSSEKEWENVIRHLPL